MITRFCRPSPCRCDRVGAPCARIGVRKVIVAELVAAVWLALGVGVVIAWNVVKHHYARTPLPAAAAPFAGIDVGTRSVAQPIMSEADRSRSETGHVSSTDDLALTARPHPAVPTVSDGL